MSEQTNKRKVSALIVSGILLLVSIFLMWGMISNWGSVKISRNSAFTANGREYSYLSYIPKAASDENPYPCVIVFHGGSDNAQNFDGWQMELVRRGYAVFSLDENGTTYTETGINNEDLVVEFTNMIQGLPFIDPDRVVTTGHSMGGLYTIITNQECDIAGGIVAHSIRDDLTYDGNLAFVFGDADIFNRWSDEKAALFYSTAFGTDGSEPEPDKVYGSLENKDYKLIHWQSGNGSHPSARWNADVVATVCKYAEVFAPTGTSLAPTDQLYQVMFFISLIGIGAFFAFVVNLMLALLKLPFFSEVKRPIPQYMGVKGKEWAFSAALTMLPTIPFYLICGYITAKLTAAAGVAGTGTRLFPVGTLNKFLLFIVVQGIWDTITFFLIFHRKKKLPFAEYGLCWEGDRSENMRRIGKTVLLAMITAAFALTFLDILDRNFGLGFTAWWMSIRSINFDRVLYASGYLIAFFFVYLGAQFGSNIVRRLPSTGRENLDMVRDIAVNVLVGGLMIWLLFFFQYWTQNQQIYITLINNTITTHQFYGYTLIVTCAQAINTVLYRKTGTIWPGLILLTIVFGYIVPAGFPISLTL